MSFTSATIELFREDMATNIRIVQDNLDMLSFSDKRFAESMLEFYDEKGWLSNAQMSHMVRFWQLINERR